MLGRYGCRNWWPGETCYEVVVGCILTQNTNWTNVEKAIENLRNANALHPARLLELSEERLIELTRSTGFFTQKPKRLRRVTEWWIEKIGPNDIPLVEVAFKRGDGRQRLGVAGQHLRQGSTSQTVTSQLRQELLAINGIGPETADAILLYAFGLPIFVVDAYKRRILSRIGVTNAKASYAEVQELFHRTFQPDVPFFSDFHAQFIEHGKNHCRKQPRCGGCPLLDKCSTGLQNGC